MANTTNISTANEAESLKQQKIIYIIHHIFLPPQVPQQYTSDLLFEDDLLNTVIDSLQAFKCLARDDGIDSVIAMIENTRASQDESGSINQVNLKGVFKRLRGKGNVALHVRAQNAGILISAIADKIYFEAFELSPDMASVMRTKGRLKRSFPGFAISVASSIFSDDTFQSVIAQAIAKMSAEPVEEMRPLVTKASQELPEIRDTIKPDLVAQHLLGFLRACGEPVNVSTVWKNTREEFLWKDALLPWRRSPTWLLVRVSMQLAFSRLSKNPSKSLYKPFMAFLMSCVLGVSMKLSLESHLLHVMNAKLAQRIEKLGDLGPQHWLKEVQDVMSRAAASIESAWASVISQSSPTSNLSSLQHIQPTRDVVHKLPALDNLIDSFNKLPTTSGASVFHPTEIFPCFAPDSLPVFPLQLGSLEASFGLAAFESWVEQHLDAWLKQHISDSTTCTRVMRMMEAYYDDASRQYAGNPEASSVMILTIIELWISCDKSACHLFDILLDYDHEVVRSLLWSLLLPSKLQMLRLDKIEGHLKYRSARAVAGFSSPFRNFGHKSSFAVRYFDQSPRQQSLLADIEEKATRDREAKRQELSRLNEKYWTLMQLYDEAVCEVYDYLVDQDEQIYESRHKPGCQRCDYECRAQALKIQIHEWPLAEDRNQAKAIVFEIEIPPAYGAWRDATHFLLKTVLRYDYLSRTSVDTNRTLNNDPALRNFFSPATERIGIRSRTKPHMATHRAFMKIPTADDSVCLNNGSSYRYFDIDSNYFTSPFVITDKLHNLCTFELPVRSRKLQRFMSRTPSEPNGPPPNEVIASQDDCPDHMTLEEYKAFGTLPIGLENQWINVLTQLAIPEIDFAKPETAILLLQVAQQVGPDDGSAERPSHKALTTDRFAWALLEKLGAAKERVGENWESSQGIGTFVSLTTRLLSLSSSARTLEGCLKYLASCRFLAFSWLERIRIKIDSSTDDIQRTEFATQAIALALVCIETFNVDDEYLSRILATSDASLLIQCSVSIQEYLLSEQGEHKMLTSLMLARWKKLMYRAQPQLVHQIVVAGSNCLDRAIYECWPDYSPGLAWRPLSKPHDHWLESSTASDDKPLFVHYNLLTASLLVNNSPLARLPAAYEADPYSIFFGRSSIQIRPSRVPGFDYSARSKHFGFTVHFGMVSIEQQADLLLRAIEGDQEFTLVPARVLSGALPSAFTREFVHWYKHTSGEMLFCPASTPWPTSADSWKAVKKSAGWEVVKGDRALVATGSSTAQVLSEIIPLDDCAHMHILFCKEPRALEIELPRLQLGFFLEHGTQHVRSCQFRGMIIDPNQNIDTLVGLRSKIVLRHTLDHTQHRLVLIPDGTVFLQRSTDHVAVQIERGSGSRVHAYSIDKLLCRVIDNGNLQSKLFLAYLHALTSYCIPDPLTKRTGTEQAIFILRSAAVRSFKVLKQGDIDLLEQIAKLAPKRSFYPDKLRVMQTVQWNPDLGFLAQDGQLYTAVGNIFAQAEATKFLYPETHLKLPLLDFTEEDLLQRDIIRASTFRVSGFGADAFTVDHDAVYRPRDRDQDSHRARRTFIVARSVIEKRPVIRDIDLLQMHDCLWNKLKSQTSILGPRSRPPPTSLLYGSQLLGPTASLLGPQWCSLHVTLSEPLGTEKFQLMMWLATLAFAREADTQLIYTMLAFYCIPALAQVTPPDQTSFKPRNGDCVGDVETIVRSHFRQYSRCPEANLPQRYWESKAQARQRRLEAYQSKKKEVIEEFVQVLESQWICQIPEVPQDNTFIVYIGVDAAMAEIRDLWNTWFHNHHLHQYLNQVEDLLRRQVIEPIQVPRFELPRYQALSPQRRFISTEDVFALHPTEFSETTPDSLESLGDSRYVDDLRDSLAHLSRETTENFLDCSNEAISSILDQHYTKCKEHVQKLFHTMTTDTNRVSEIANIVHQYPRTSPMFFLQQLSHRYWLLLPGYWKWRLIQYAVALTAQQRSERLWRARGSHVELIAELANVGHRNWDPMQYPDWLLLEVEGGILIREVQADITHQMLTPEGGGNSVMQMNMGEGKTTVIVPCIGAVLADGTKLVRAVVARPQSKQMAEVLVQRLGGLVDRPIYYMPFSRSLQLSATEVKALRRILTECMKGGGILLVQPEHILSFQLMGVECSTNGNHQLAIQLLKTQLFLDTHSRDVIDECDENFSVKFELVYTMGMPQPVEFSPDRWIIIQHILNLVARFAPEIQRNMGSEVVEIYDPSPGRFPRIRLLRPEGSAALLEKIAGHVCEYGVPSFPVTHFSSVLRAIVSRYITEACPTTEDLDQLRVAREEGVLAEGAYNALLLLRGLIAGNILSFTFGAKRWRVNYGLDQKRLPPTKITVPFRAKDSPEPRSDFSHTDVLIVLTSLSYYYGGLDDNDLFTTFGHLLDADQANVEYRLWIKTAPELPYAFRKLSGINIKDQSQCKGEVFPALRYSKGAIDYFLANIVFPKAMKEFPHKITTSGWDLGRVKANVTTGFSGTNDSRHLLPLDVKHLHLRNQKKINALVMKHILQDENSVSLLSSQEGDRQASNAQHLLNSITRLGSAVRVIIDVGAQILEMDNEEVAREWLGMWKDDGRTKAAIFFNNDDEISVIDRTGHIQLLQTSPFASQTGLCLVFLDDAHTRGTDLKLPINYCAAVTLGANLTKDKLVQACMRMRKLGKGHSLVFCVPEDIRVQILALCKKNDNTRLEVIDVVMWAINETSLDLQRNLPLWAAQGRRFIDQSRIWREVKTETDIESFMGRAYELLEKERQTLEDHYRPKEATSQSDWDSTNEKIKRIIEHCRDFGCFDFDTANLQEEQERELSPEKERVRQLEKTVPATPRVHSTHPDLIHFVTTGEIRVQSPAFIPAFQSLRNSTAAQCFDLSQFPRNLLVTTDFAYTVESAATDNSPLDSFQRPVQWILTSQSYASSSTHMVIVSPFEAGELRHTIRKRESVTLHTYAPRPSLEYHSLDHLNLFTEGAPFDPKVLPRNLIIALNIFAGQLYFGSREEYIDVCKYLGLAWESQREGIDVKLDGFITGGGESTFRQSPVAFLKILTTKIRRNCQSIDKTHLGKVLEGWLLERRDFDT